MTTYQPSQLSNLRAANTNIMSFTAPNSQPLLQFMNNTQTTLPYYFATRNTDGMPMYLYKIDDSNYRFVTFANASGVVWYDITAEFDTWLSSNGSALLQCPITLPNGTFNYVFVTKKRNYTYTTGAYAILWAEHSQFWNTPPDVSDIPNYISSLYSYDFRLFTDNPTFYTPQIQSDIKSYVTTGSVVAPPPSPPPVIGNLYTTSDFSSVSVTDVDVVLFSAQNGPVITVQHAGTDGIFKKVVFNQGTVGYVLLTNNQYKFVTTNTNNYSGFVVIDTLFAAWLTNNFYYTSAISLTVAGTLYSNVFITVKPLIAPSLAVIPIDVNNQSMWSAPDTTQVHHWLTTIQTYDVRFFTSSNFVWFNPTVQSAITDYVTSIMSIAVASGYAPTVNTTAATSTNLIYAESLYNNDSTYFSNVATLLQKEYNEEVLLQNVLSTNDAQLLADLQTFVNTQSTNIAQQLANIQSLTTNLQNIVNTNLANISANTNLYNFINSPQAIALTNQIIQLRDTIYASIQFLSSKGRLTNTTDIVYLINKTKI